MLEEARKFLAEEGGVSESAWKEHRRFVLGDTKRKYRSLAQSSAKAARPKAARFS